MQQEMAERRVNAKRQVKGDRYGPSTHTEAGKRKRTIHEKFQRRLFQFGPLPVTAKKIGSDWLAWSEHAQMWGESQICKGDDGHEVFTRMTLAFITYNVYEYNNRAATLRNTLAGIARVMKQNYNIKNPLSDEERPVVNLYLGIIGAMEPKLSEKLPFPPGC